ncbi:MAG: ATP--guanido phosphotransferase [Clostridia bacterium]|nr:ATP--guanido phosphotransferase [Clostridia bacterium]
MKNAVSTRIRFARNIAGVKFLSSMTSEEKRELLLKIKDEAKKTGDFDFIDMSALSDIRAGELVEKHLISPEFAENRENCGVLLGKDGITSIMINEEDHLRIQVIMPGLCLEKALKKAKELEKKLDDALGFAYSEELGYLTHCPSNIGTGMRASVMLHLPAMTETGAIGRLPSVLSQNGLTVRGLYGEGTRAGGAIYQISNCVSLGLSEEEIIERLDAMIKKIDETETALTKQLFENERVADRVSRALGTLKYAKLISSSEALKLLSDVRFGAEAGVLDSDLGVIDRLSTDIQPCSMEIAADGKNRDAVRAEKIRNTL